MNVSNIKVSYGTEKIKSSKIDWELTDTLKEQIIEYAKEDAKRNVYMGDKFKCLRKNEVAKLLIKPVCGQNIMRGEIEYGNRYIK